MVTLEQLQRLWCECNGTSLSTSTNLHSSLIIAKLPLYMLAKQAPAAQTWFVDGPSRLCSWSCQPLGSQGISAQPNIFWASDNAHLPLSTKLLSSHPSPPRYSHSVIPASPSNYWGIISVWLLMYECDPVTCESLHYLPGFPCESKNSLTTKTDAFYLFCLPSCLWHFCTQLSSASVQTTQGVPAWIRRKWALSWGRGELSKVWEWAEVQREGTEK